MAFLLKLLGLGRPDADELFLRGRDAFAAGSYGSALSYFERAAKRFGSNEEMRINSLMNAAMAASYATEFEYATDLFYSVALRRLEDENGNKNALDPLEKAFQSALQASELPEVSSEILAGLFLLKVISRRLEDVQKLAYYIDMLDRDDYITYMETIWQNMMSDSPDRILAEFPFIELPKVFRPYQNKAENLLRGYFSLSIGIPYSNNEFPPGIQVGESIEFEATVSAFATLNITNCRLTSGAKGIITKEPDLKFPLVLSEGSTLPLKYTIQPQISGEWEIGPLTITYSIGEDEFEYPSNKIKAMINPKKALITTKVIPECVTEDFEYNLDIYVSNASDGVAEGIEIAIEPPEGVEIVTGTSWKQIASLSPQQSFNFTVTLRFDVSSRTTGGHEILIKTTYEDSVIKETVVIGES
ncbi:MAG: hypothetical protein ACFFCQ_13630 [Promethearchaeota archaeon]